MDEVISPRDVNVVKLKDDMWMIDTCVYEVSLWAPCPCPQCNGETIRAGTMYLHVRRHNVRCKKKKSDSSYRPIEPGKVGRKFKFVGFAGTTEVDAVGSQCDDQGDSMGSGSGSCDEYESDRSYDSVDSEEEDEEAVEGTDRRQDSVEAVPPSHDDSETGEDVFSEKDRDIMDTWMNSSVQGRLGDVLPGLLQWVLDTSIPKTHLNALLDLLHPLGFPTSNAFRGVIRRMNLTFSVRVTCPSEHTLKDESFKGMVCGFEDQAGKCMEKMTKCIRQDSIKNILKRKLKNKEFSRAIKWPFGRRQWSMGKQGRLESIWDGDFIHNMRQDHRFKEFLQPKEGEYYPILLGIFADGFSPHSGVNKSVFAVKLICYNLPVHIRTKKENIQVLMLVDGPNEPKNFQRYLGTIIDEIEKIEKDGVWLFDSDSGREVLFKVALINCVCDGRSQRACACHSEAGSMFPCLRCSIKGERSGNKYVYSNIPCLPRNHPYRQDEKFGNSLDKPDKRVWEIKQSTHIHEMSKLLESESLDLENDNHKIILGGVEGRTQFFRLEYFDFQSCICICLMHTFLNVVSRIEQLAVGKTDTLEARMQMEIDGIKKDLWPVEKGGKSYLPPAGWVLEQSKKRKRSSQVEVSLETALRWLKNIRRPSSMDGDPSRLFQQSSSFKGTKAKRKAQPYKDFATSGILAAAFLIGGMEESYVQLFDSLFQNMRKLLCPVVDRQEFEKLGEDILISICNLESEIPRTEMVANIHNLSHLPRQCLDFGPASETWAYPMESALGSLKVFLRNKAHPAASMFVRHLENESIRLMRDYMGRDDVADFMLSPLEPLAVQGKVTRCTLTNDDIGAIKMYIQEEWAEFSSLARRLGLSVSDGQQVWDESRALDMQQLEEFSFREKSIAGGINPQCMRAKKFKINRTVFTAMTNSGRDNSRALVKHKNQDIVGTIQDIIVLEMLGGQEIFVKVKLFSKMSQHPVLQKRPVAHDNIRQQKTIIWIQDTKILAQVFLADDITCESSPQENRYLVFCKGPLRPTSNPPSLC